MSTRPSSREGHRAIKGDRILLEGEQTVHGLITSAQTTFQAFSVLAVTGSHNPTAK